MLCTSSFTDDIMFGHNWPYGNVRSGTVILAQCMMSMNASFLIGINSKLECDVLLSKSIMELAPVLLLLCMLIR